VPAIIAADSERASVFGDDLVADRFVVVSSIDLTSAAVQP